MNNEQIQNVIFQISDHLNHLTEQPKARKAVPHRIKWLGKFIRTRSGKTVWKRIGDAKCAFRHEIEDILRRGIEVETGRYPRDNDKDAVVNEMIRRGLVEFVPFVDTVG
jgi:AAA+ ATPase superfamily predicted ATPase